MISKSESWPHIEILLDLLADIGIKVIQEFLFQV